MSLLLIAHSDKLAVIGSDGRISRVEPDGSRYTVADNVPKFSVLAPHLVVGTTGKKDIGDDIEAASRRFVRQQSSPTGCFQALADFLATASRHYFFAYPDHGPNTELSVVLVGYDAERDSLRCVSWIDREGFNPVEETDSEWNLFAFATQSLCRPMVSLLREQLRSAECVNVSTISHAMQSVIAEASCISASVNDRCYLYTIDRFLVQNWSTGT